MAQERATGRTSGGLTGVTGPEPQAPWVDLLKPAGVAKVAVVGGSGRLGSLLTHLLTRRGVEVLVLDSRPCESLAHTSFRYCDIANPATILPSAFDGVDAVVHLAALHGAHLVAGYPRGDFWKVNVRGTEHVLRAAHEAGVRRAVIASSTSIYGSGSAVGEPAHVLDEAFPLRPEDVYDLTKLAGEELLRQYATQGAAGVALRFGRFFFPSHVDYHLRKLSTGLDALDACQAIVRALASPVPAPFSAYCIASDLPLDRDQRARLGTELPAVLGEAIPELVEAARHRSVTLPARVGKSVDTGLARERLGYAPERALDWTARMWLAELHTRRRSRVPSRRWLESPA
ncbi:NAD(P)-dependent oxidoreductase [Kitasatospora sp. NBC_01287]|uniref:NAD-dependent epimerase/dehydratase family protein n=1 Tax=Kitasatospora sp. NBC_01287 TaxID=2903573 RepID=UPI002258CFA9|nr:NAD(P)-dependent oxidoreductase [Kitasatospora sp. NBC_01287]MCX4745124.1 NAD(P)-dependent oxidoreductase [Kitasatospora sp. NBC_01287]